MRFLIEIEDTHQGIRATAFMEPNAVSTDYASSLAAFVVGNMTQRMKELEEMGLLIVDHPEDE